MNVEQILRDKGDWVATIQSEATVAEAVDILNRRRIGALVVSDDGVAVDGILAERDIAAALAEFGAGLLERSVGEVMSREMVTCDPSDSVGELMAEMTDRRIRHFPVVEDGRLVAIVSLKDLMDFLAMKLDLHEPPALRAA